MIRLVVFISVLSLWACSPDKVNYENHSGANGLHYAKRFSLTDSGAYKRVNIFGDRDGARATSSFILAEDTNGLGERFSPVRVIRIPCRNIAALSSIYASMIFELGCIDQLAAIDNIDYVTNEQIIEKHRRGSLAELARTPDIDLERTLVLDPDIVFAYGMGYNTESDKNTLRKTSIPMAVSVDHLESSPLGRAEWIKFFGAFLGKDREADSIFSQVEKNYLRISREARTHRQRPTVFSETKYGDVWYMPGGKSFMALLLRDAGASYLWSDNSEVGSLPLSFEQVYSRAKDADYWINLPLVKSKKELLAQDKRYGEFKSFRQGQIFNNSKFRNASGYSNYWETGMIFPDRILHDLVTIFHGDHGKTDLYYYEKLK